MPLQLRSNAFRDNHSLPEGIFQYQPWLKSFNAQSGPAWAHNSARYIKFLSGAIPD